MDELRYRIDEDLTDLIEGDIRTDPASIASYSTDASLYEIEPLAVAMPRSAEDVEQLAAWSAENEIPLIARGSGSGLAGGALGQGVVLDFSRYMNRIISMSGDQVRVQPGITREKLNRALLQHGRYFAPDPSGTRTTTVGGMLGVDAAGSHAVRVGSARDHVFSVECVVSGGQRFEAGMEPLLQDTGSIPRFIDHNTGMAGTSTRTENIQLAARTAATRKASILQHLAALLRDNSDLIRKHQPPLIRNCCGYMLRNILSNDRLDLPRLLTGSEGTLAAITEATLFTMPLPEHRSAAMLMFGSLESAIRAVQLILPMDPSACDLLDRRLLSLGRERDPRFSPMIHSNAEAGLIVEFCGSGRAEVQQRLDDMQTRLRSGSIVFQVTRVATEFEDVELLWSLPSQVVSLLATFRGESRPLPFVEDIAIPPEELTGFLASARTIFQKHELTATLYAHAASGQLHFRPIIPVPSRNLPTPMEEIARDLYRQVIRYGGSISGEHGDGLSRTSFVRTQYGPLYRIFQQVKEIFDPLSLMNPNKIVSNDPRLTIRHLRSNRVTGSSEKPETALLPVMELNWSAAGAAEAAVDCNGCATCRVPDEHGRMCPFVDDESEELLSPRAKANLLRQALCHPDSKGLLQSESARRIVESCFNCRQCQLECPSEVNIPHALVEARAQFFRQHGHSRSSWLLSRIHTYAGLLSRFAFPGNQLLRSRVVRRLLQRFLGLAANRRLPAFARRSFLDSARVQRPDNTGAPGSARPTVVYFVDYFSNHHDTELAEAFVRVLEHNGFRVFVPREQTISGMNMISVADLTAARDVAEQNLRELAEPAREGYPILCTEPSAALCLKQDYPRITANQDAEVVARQTLDAGTFLLELYRQGRLKTDFAPIPLTIAWHTPCHIRALTPTVASLELLRLIPELKVLEIEKGCTGMAGTFGLASENFSTSLKIGEKLISAMATIDADAGATDCSSCRMQMEQGAEIPTLHPIKLLALSYGLMPRLARQLKSRPSGLSMS